MLSLSVEEIVTRPVKAVKVTRQRQELSVALPTSENVDLSDSEVASCVYLLASAIHLAMIRAIGLSQYPSNAK
jgi:hypothetical protein